MSCELCNQAQANESFTVAPSEISITICADCLAAMDDPKENANHWRCLSESIWSEKEEVKVVAYRLLSSLEGINWADDLKNSVYLDDTTLNWAENVDVQLIHKDSNGNVLETGDSVTLIQDLNVKGANFTAKRGTMVKKIRLVEDNAGQIEGKVEGQQIVILTKYVKKA